MKIARILTALLSVWCLIASAVADSTNSTSLGTAEKTKSCFQCNGKGETKCPVVTCKGGQADCPGPCMKLSKGSWVRMDVAGHSPTELWQRFPKKDGGWAAWNQSHVGEVIQTQNGEAVNIGKCSVCSGTTRTKCASCKGAGKVVCSLCAAKKVIPVSWTAFDNPKMKNRPSHFKLKSGTVLVGRKVMAVGSSVTIRTEKEDVKVEASDIVEEVRQTTQK